MKYVECDVCEGRGGILDWPYPCDLCRGVGAIPAEWIEPREEEPPPHTDADMPPWVEATQRCDGCLKNASRCTCEDEVNENELRAYLDGR